MVATYRRPEVERATWIEKLRSEFGEFQCAVFVAADIENDHHVTFRHLKQVVRPRVGDRLDVGHTASDHLHVQEEIVGKRSRDAAADNIKRAVGIG